MATRMRSSSITCFHVVLRGEFIPICKKKPTAIVVFCARTADDSYKGLKTSGTLHDCIQKNQNISTSLFMSFATKRSLKIVKYIIFPYRIFFTHSPFQIWLPTREHNDCPGPVVTNIFSRGSLWNMDGGTIRGYTIFYHVIRFLINKDWQ